MAQFFPDFNKIKKFNPPPTKGEFKLLNFFYKHLDDTYEIYFQPFFNGDRPDIVLMKKNTGVLIIEVKDWDLDKYNIDEKGNWYLKNKPSIKIKSPFKQVEIYKQNLFNFHIESLLEKKIKNKKLFAVLRCSVYFHKYTQKEVRDFLQEKENLKFIKILGEDLLEDKNKFIGFLDILNLTKKSKFFTDDIYEKFRIYLTPPNHLKKQGEEISYTEKQTELIKSKPGNTKILGIVGSGKTTVLAKRAVNAHKRTNSKVLILTYNITLKNYIHDKISKVRENFNWGNFHINNYHNFIQSQLNNYGISLCKCKHYKKEPNLQKYTKCLEKEYFSNTKIFEEFKQHKKSHKYSAIFIDEIQDYKTEWIKILKQYFLKENGEFVVFGDEKQNIYKRELYNDKKPNTGIPGRWNKLDESFRLAQEIISLANEFQNYFFSEKYDLDKINLKKTRLILDEDEKEEIKYLFFECEQNEIIFQQIKCLLDNLTTHKDDICFLASKVEFLRELDFYLRNNLKFKTSTTFETKEMWEKFNFEKNQKIKKIKDNLKQKNEENPEEKIKKINVQFKMQIEDIRRNKKFHFWPHSGLIKLSTIHSFKGWEIPNLFLIIDNEKENKNFVSSELIYTGITRCKNNLFILNLGNSKYHEFFNKAIDKKTIISCPKT